jgi:hypothetical protein
MINGARRQTIGDMLSRADEHLIDWAAPDLAGRASVQLARYALARIHHLEEQLGVEPSATCIVAPDSSPSRNPQRLAGGYSTGGELWWNPEHPILPLDSLPNCCGIALAQIELRRSPADYYQALHNLATKPPHLDGVPIIVDVNRKNHFVGIYRDNDDTHYAVVHCSAPEYRHDSPTGFGLNVYDSPELSRSATVANTPAGPLTHLEQAADRERYIHTTELARDYARRKRARILETTFGDNTRVIADRQHQGFAQANHIVLGAQLPDPASDTYVYLLGADQPLHLTTRSQPAGLPANLSTPALVPHGCGHTYQTEYTTIDVELTARGFTFTLTAPDSQTAITGSLDHLPATDRGTASLRAAAHHGLLSDQQTLTLVVNLRLP